MVPPGTTCPRCHGSDLDKTGVAKKVGGLLAERARAKDIAAVVVDRSGYLYHGRVKALAEGAREGGLVFSKRK